MHLLIHAAKRGFPVSTVSGNDWIFADPKSGAKAIVQFDPSLTEKSGYLTFAKGVLTAAMNGRLGFEPTPRYSERHPKRMNPSSNAVDYWLFAESAANIAKIDQADYDVAANMGKWLIFSNTDSVDEDWKKIKRCVESGQLSVSAKVSTYRNSMERNHDNTPTSYVICVYTLDWRDKDDVFRHRETLRQQGFNKPLSYKTNEMTRQGKSGSAYRG